MVLIRLHNPGLFYFLPVGLFNRTPAWARLNACLFHACVEIDRPGAFQSCLEMSAAGYASRLSNHCPENFKSDLHEADGDRMMGIWCHVWGDV